MSPLSNGSPKLLSEKKLISLVQQREILYKGNGENIPFGKLKLRANTLWADIAYQMGQGWTVAECKRKWSHIRNSYSRHLRNEVTGATTMTGRAVSKWHLADELEFLRPYMATEYKLNSSTNSTKEEVTELDDNPWGTKIRIINSGGQFYYDPTAEHNYLTSDEPYTNVVHCEETAGSEESTAALLTITRTDNDDLEVTPSIFTETLDNDDNNCTTVNDSILMNETGTGNEAEDDLIRFFSGVNPEYNILNSRRKRLFKQRCLGVLYHLIDEQEKESINEVTLYSVSDSQIVTHTVFDNSLNDPTRVKVECNEETVNSEIEVITEE